MAVWAITLSEDEPMVLSVGLSPDVSTPIADAQVGRLLVLFRNRATALLYTRAMVQGGYFRPGEYTLYTVPSLPWGSSAQEVVVAFDDPELGSARVVMVSPPEVPAKFIHFSERRVIEGTV